MDYERGKRLGKEQEKQKRLSTARDYGQRRDTERSEKKRGEKQVYSNEATKG